MKRSWVVASALLLSACEVTSGGSTSAADSAPAAADAAVDMGPVAPVALTPSPATARHVDYDIPNVGDAGASDLCFSWDGNSPLDPRRGLSVGNCVDTLIVRFVVIDGEGTGRALLNANFSGLQVFQDDMPVGNEALPLGTEVDIELDTIPNLLAGGERLTLSFSATLTASDLTVGEVTLTSF